jgi:hypothetical protein
MPVAGTPWRARRCGARADRALPVFEDNGGLEAELGYPSMPRIPVNQSYEEVLGTLRQS